MTTIADMDEMFITVRADRVTEHRVVAGPTAPNFYRYEFRIDGKVATERQRRALLALVTRGSVHHAESYAGTTGPTSVRMDIG